MIGHIDLASRRWIYEKYDSQVMVDTVAGPGGDAALVRVHGSSRGLALTTDCTPRYVESDPKTGGMQAVAEAYRNISAVGATPLAITNNLNFGNPEKPEIMTQLVQSVIGMGDAARHLNTPVVSGNVSLYNETDGTAIQPCPVIGMVGVIDDIATAAGNAFTAAGETIFVVGQAATITDGWLGASLYHAHYGDAVIYAAPPVDLDAEERHGTFVRTHIVNGLITAAHDISDGGLAVAVTEMAMRSKLGAAIDTGVDVISHSWAFGEDQGRYIVTTTDAAGLVRAATNAGVEVAKIGVVTDRQELKFGATDTISLLALTEAYEGRLPALMT
jgi:phosphoribosylformylglycinamidine (FGAM) synthase-like enzyme